MPTRSGRIYFVSDRPGGRGAVEAWVAESRPGGGCADPMNVAALNSEHSDSDLWVDPDEKYAILHRSIDSTRTIDFWIAFRDGDRWLSPRPLDEVTAAGWELSPTVSPSDALFYFNRYGVIHPTLLCAIVRGEELRDFGARPPATRPCADRRPSNPRDGFGLLVRRDEAIRGGDLARGGAVWRRTAARPLSPPTLSPTHPRPLRRGGE
ncbi:MAG: hypothetical protein ACT4P6_16765 [Gemmatimonadaceae bacterium]